MILNFALLKKGDEIYNRAEQLVKYFIGSLTVDDVSRLLAGLHSIRKGSPDIIGILVANFLKNLDQAGQESIVLVAPVLKFIEGVKEDTYVKLDEHILSKKLIENMNTYELGEVAKGFGYSRGS